MPNNPYPFGLMMSGRSWSDGYRFGFNSYENDSEVLGTGNYSSYENYGYDTRISRRWKLDPLSYKIPFQSPYCHANNSPIGAIDVNGDSTVYISIKGDILFIGHDNLPNSIVTIEDIEKFKFNTFRLISLVSMDKLDSDYSANFLRRYGKNYMIEQYFDFDDRYKQEFGETQFVLYEKNNSYYIDDNPDNFYIAKGSSYVRRPLVKVNQNDPEGHLHPTSDNFEYGPSGDNDIPNHKERSKNSFLIVIGNSKKGDGERSVYLYNYDGKAYNGNIEVRRDVFQESKSKSIESRINLKDE